MHVYCITNHINDKIYIGQHAGDNLQSYFNHNVKAALGGRGNKKALYSAIRKYGPENFSISSLVKITELDADTAREVLDKLEIFFIRTLDSRNKEIGYNLTAGGGGQLGRSYSHTEAHKKHISDLMKGRKIDWADKISAAQKGRALKPEHRAKLSASQRGRPKSPRSPEHCNKISENKKKWWADRKKEKLI